MPELPEVETTRRGIENHLKNRTINHLVIRHYKLRQPIPKNLAQQVAGAKIEAISRRGKFILLSTSKGTLIIHLGMSGSIRILKETLEPGKHDHLDIIFDNPYQVLRFTDPRRFGLVLWTTTAPLQHPLLASLGPEPFSNEFNADYLFEKSRTRKIPIKQFLMDSKIVVGIGNIYASEILFQAKVLPTRAAGKITKAEFKRIYHATQQVLERAIESGGTTLRDFYSLEGKPGYFTQQLLVYDREGESCFQCGKLIKKITQGQRSTYFCRHCQR